MSRPRTLFDNAELSFIVHSTEDEAKLVNAISQAFSIDTGTFTKTTAKGYFGNPIIYYKTVLKGETAESTFNKIFEGLQTKDIQSLLRKLERHVDKQGHLYIRIDKQSLILKRLLLGPEDAVRLKFRLKKWSPNILDWKQLIAQHVQQKGNRTE